MIDPSNLALIDIIILGVLVSVTMFYAWSTKRMADLTRRIIQRTDNDEVILFAEKRLEKVYSPVVHGERIINSMPSVEKSPPDYQFEQELRNQIDKYIFLTTDNFQRAWENLQATWGGKGAGDDTPQRKRYTECLEKFKEVAAQDYTMYAMLLGGSTRDRFPELFREDQEFPLD